jgi:hypothetical protein
MKELGLMVAASTNEDSDKTDRLATRYEEAQRVTHCGKIQLRCHPCGGERYLKVFDHYSSYWDEFFASNASRDKIMLVVCSSRVLTRLRRSSCRQPWHAKIGTSPLQPPPFTIPSHPHCHSGPVECAAKSPLTSNLATDCANITNH